MKTEITAAIQAHGAKAVYDAACKRMDGNPGPLAAFGLEAKTIGDANTIMVAAFAEMGPAGRAIDFAQASSK